MLRSYDIELSKLEKSLKINYISINRAVDDGDSVINKAVNDNNVIPYRHTDRDSIIYYCTFARRDNNNLTSYRKKEMCIFQEKCFY